MRENPDGEIVLTPITVPVPPKMSGENVRAVYIDPSFGGAMGDTLTVYSRMGIERLAALAAEIAEAEMIPIVVKSVGMGVAIVDRLKSTTSGIEIIEVRA